MSILSMLPVKTKIALSVGLAILIAGAFGAGYWAGNVKGGAAEQVACAKEETTKQTERADVAEKQRDIANAPPASVDDMLEWLSGAYKGGP